MVWKNLQSQMSLKNFLETNTSSLKKSSRTTCSSSIDTFISLVSDKLYIAYIQVHIVQNNLSLDIIIIFSTIRCSHYETHMESDFRRGNDSIFTSPLSISLWGISSLNDKVGQMFALHKFVSL